MLNVARFAQGVGSGLLNPQGVGMIQHYFRGVERGRAFGFFGSTVGVSVAIGPVLGGLLIKLDGPDLGWRLTFLVNLPVGVIAIILAFLWFPRPLLRRASRTPAVVGQRASRSMDPVGSVLLGLAVLAILFPFVEAQTAPLTWLLLPLGIILVAAWALWERHYTRLGHSPMVDLKIFRTRSFTNGTVLVALYFLGMTSVWVLVAMYMQEGLGKVRARSGDGRGPVGAPLGVRRRLGGQASDDVRPESRHRRPAVQAGRPPPEHCGRPAARSGRTQ